MSNDGDYSWAILSGTTNGYTAKLAAKLKELGYQYQFAIGKWDNHIEPAIVIESIDNGTLAALAREYKQDCYIRDGWLIFTLTGETVRVLHRTDYDKIPPAVRAWTYIGGIYVVFEWDG